MCISHGIQFSHAFWEMYHVAKMILGQRCCGLTKRWIPFAFIYGIDYSFGMVKSVSTLGPSGKKKGCTSVLFSFLGRFSLPPGYTLFFPLVSTSCLDTNSVSAVPLPLCLICTDIF